LGGSGIIIFVLSSRLLAKRLSENPAETLITRHPNAHEHAAMDNLAADSGSFPVLHLSHNQIA